MFRFSIRDLFWLTLVVALILGWLVREQEAQAEVRQANLRTNRWRMGAGVLEYVLKESGRVVIWDLKGSMLMVEEPSAELSGYSLSSGPWEPSAKDE